MNGILRRVRIAAVPDPATALPGAATLEAVQGRRRQLLGLLMLLFVLAALGAVLFSYATEVLGHGPLEFLDLSILRLSFAALAGAFALYVWEKERTLDRLERDLIEQRVLASALSQRLDDLSAISRAGRAVASVLSLEDVLSLILESAQDLLGATEGSVMLLDGDKRSLRIAASVGLGNQVTEVIPVGESVSGWVAEFRQPVILNDEDVPARFRGFIPKDREVRSAMSAPLYARAEPVGVLNVSVSTGGREYGDHDLRALTVFAEHAASAIANARLFEAERATAARLEETDGRRRDLLAVVTHDLRAPLTAILGYARLLRDFGDRATPEQRGEFTEAVESQGARMLEMLDQLVMAASVEDGGSVLATDALELESVVRGSLAAFGGVLQGRAVVVDIPDGAPPVSGDRSAIEHVLANLLDNAVKYSPPDSPIDVAVEPVADEVRVSVGDRGPGMPDDLLLHVFDRYRRGGSDGRQSGVGLGLFIVRSMAEGQGGRVWAENRPGGGAKVTFALPAARLSEAAG